ncbi:MAG: hydantoinase/oxoprolinase family protein [Ramlibacter sp.]|nr:hydantoinase/oxoprolinase family protein [Ramlibacter sp.]
MSTLMGVDVGGTFTDVVLVRDGVVQVTKVPSVVGNPERAVLEGARRLGASDATIFNHASTKGLNAVLTRNLPKIGFLTTEGHRDLLDAGRGWRPWDVQLNPRWHRPFGDAARPLVRRYLRRGVRERILASGEVLVPFDAQQARAQLELLRRCEVQGVAICLINSYANPAHENELAALAREVLGPDIPISISSQVGPRAKEYARASTTVIDVFMKLIYGGYARQLSSGLGALGFSGRLNFADCTAALIPWQAALQSPHRILFAGPAAGTASCVALGRAIGDRNLIGCDVGGTSTDVSMIVEGAPFINDSFEIEWDLVVNALSTEVSSVGAGGGSIIGVSASGDITVGPGSAGAVPGPACYGRGGTQPTVTDACLLMGILDGRGFAAGQLELDEGAARRAFESLDSALGVDERIAFAWKVALNNIAEEVVNVAIRHGADPRDFSLVAFGSAGPMLLAGALELTGARRVLVPPHPGLFSALGLLSTDLVYADSRSHYLMLAPDNAAAINQLLCDMEAGLRERVPPDVEVRVLRSLDARLLGQSWETPFVAIAPGPVTEEGVAGLIDRFHAEYERRNGQAFREMPVQGVTWRVQLVAASTHFEWPAIERQVGEPTPAAWRVLRHLAGKPVEAGVYSRAALGCGAFIKGPAVIQEPLATILVAPGQGATVGAFGEISIESVS